MRKVEGSGGRATTSSGRKEEEAHDSDVTVIEVGMVRKVVSCKDLCLVWSMVERIRKKMRSLHKALSLPLKKRVMWFDEEEHERVQPRKEYNPLYPVIEISWEECKEI